MIIENGRVKFKNSNSKGYKSDPKLFRDYLSDVRKRINQLKAQRQAKEQNLVGERKYSSNDSTPSSSRRSSVAKGTRPEPANIIPWSSQNSSSRQDYVRDNQIEGRTSVSQRQRGDVDQYSALQRVDQRPQIEERTSVSQRQRGDVDQYSALQRVDRRPQIEGGNRERLALPASESSNSEVNNSGNRDRRMNKGNSDRLSPVPRDGFGNNKVSQSSNTENIRRQIADEKIQAQKANTEGFLDAPDSNMYKYAEKEVDAFGNEHEIGESPNPQFIDPTGAVGNQNSDNNLNYLDANQGMGTVGSQNFIGGSGTRLSLPGGK